MLYRATITNSTTTHPKSVLQRVFLILLAIKSLINERPELYAHAVVTGNVTLLSGATLGMFMPSCSQRIEVYAYPSPNLRKHLLLSFDSISFTLSSQCISAIFLPSYISVGVAVAGIVS